MPLGATNVSHLYGKHQSRRNRRIVAGRVDGWTEYEAIGAWRGKLENSLIVELFSTTHRVAAAIAEEIAATNNQDAVALVELPEITVLVSARERVEK